MLEFPEAVTIARQAREALVGRTITSAVAGHSPHAFAWFSEGPQWYGEALAGRTVDDVVAFGGWVEFRLGDLRLGFHDGARLTLLDAGAKRPAKHQFLAEFDDGRALVCTVQMYAGIALFHEGEMDDDAAFYYDVARDNPSPLAVTASDFRAMIAAGKATLTAKGLLATEQRIPGIGNGCLQDILWSAQIHPKTKVRTLSDAEVSELHAAYIATVSAMVDGGGRDVEKDLFGQPGGYRQILSAKTVEQPCPRCGSSIVRKAYMGGNVYFCPTCQPF
jgi:formamidopyrimidine-DNA glycosylase